jgi:hypothetical protein
MRARGPMRVILLGYSVTFLSKLDMLWYVTDTFKKTLSRSHYILTGFYHAEGTSFFLSLTVDKCKISVYARVMSLHSSINIVAIYWLDDSRQRIGFFSRSKGPDLLWGPPNLLLLGAGGPFLGGKAADCKADNLTPPVYWQSMRGSKLLLPSSVCLCGVHSNTSNFLDEMLLRG